MGKEYGKGISGEDGGKGKGIKGHASLSLDRNTCPITLSCHHVL
jgi:hypothetical protein